MELLPEQSIMVSMDTKLSKNTKILLHSQKLDNQPNTPEKYVSQKEAAISRMNSQQKKTSQVWAPTLSPNPKNQSTPVSNTAPQKKHTSIKQSQKTKNSIFLVLHTIASVLKEKVCKNQDIALNHEEQSRKKERIWMKLNIRESALRELDSIILLGMYILGKQVRALSQQSLSRYTKSPQFWRTHHNSLEKLNKQKRKELGPGAAEYHPTPLAYELFEQKKKINRVVSQRKLQRNKSDRFRRIQSGSPRAGPGLYNLVNQWAPQGKNKKGILSLISKISPPSIYYK